MSVEVLDTIFANQEGLEMEKGDQPEKKKTDRTKASNRHLFPYPSFFVFSDQFFGRVAKVL